MPTSHVRWWNRLSVRLPAFTALGTLVVVGTAVWIVLQAQERYLIREVVRSAELFSETIKSSTYHDMLADRRENAYLIMNTIGEQAGVERVRFFNKEGRVTFSTDTPEIDTYVDKKGEACYGCHEAGRPLERLATGTRSRIYPVRNHRVVGMVTPIYNEEACWNAACHAHPETKRVLGVIDIGISLADIDREHALLRQRSLAVSALAIVGLIGLVGFFAQRSLVRPVNELVRATQNVAAGDYTQQIRVATTNELGALERAYNQMLEALSKARAERRHLLATLEQQVEERTIALKNTQAQLVQSEKLSSLGRLAASIAHEINNPLAGILTYAKLLIRMLDDEHLDGQTRQAATRHLRLVQRETERCTAIVRNLLEFARQRPLSIKDVDVAGVVEEAVSLIAHQAALQGISIEHCCEEVPLVPADMGQIRQALVNVMLNGCEAMVSGGTLSVACRPSPDGRFVHLAVTDTGVGIPPDRMARIFDPFFSTKEKGTGLGLSVVYGIVDRHQGTVDISSTVGSGTTITIKLPTKRKGDGPTIQRS
ncbi:MAG: ATP-binding protein [Acidobacteriota bacterium]